MFDAAQLNQDELYGEAAAEYGPAIERLARSYEADPEKRRDLLQEIHLAIWRSFEGSGRTARCGHGCIAWRTTWPRRTWSAISASVRGRR